MMRNPGVPLLGVTVEVTPQIVEGKRAVLVQELNGRLVLIVIYIEKIYGAPFGEERHQEEIAVINKITAHGRTQRGQLTSNISHDPGWAVVVRGADHGQQIRVPRCACDIVSIDVGRGGSLSNSLPGRLLDKYNVILIQTNVKKGIN